jgi:serine/threonine protein kinase
MLRQTRVGRYEVGAVLGRAPMGMVYKATDVQTGRAVAVRTIELDLSESERAEFEAIFYREASAARLIHPNIVPIHDVGAADGIAYIATDYLEGETLRELLDSSVALPIETIADIAVGVANALNYAHENHVVHGDIRPENILITTDRDVKIMNFGITPIPTDAPTQPGTGSPRYMAPEQVVGGTTDGRTDIFALGVVLYEMLTGVTPFDGDDPGANTDKLLKDAPVPPSALDPRVPPAFDRIVGRALAKRPRDRYQTALAFVRDLQNPDAYRPAGGPRDALVAASSAAPGVGVREMGASQREKAQPRRTPLLLAAAVGLIAALVIYSQSHRPQRDEPAVAVLPTPAVPAPPVDSPSPPDSTSPADSAPPADSGSAVLTPATASAKPRLAASKLPARPVASAKAPAGPKPASVPPPVSATQANATLSLAISPWGEVYVNGKSVGVSPPLTTLRLEAGMHRVEIRNQAFESYRDTVNLEPDTSVRIKHKFR